jgi:hypothetical protein
MNILNLKLPPSTGKFLMKHFEKISFIYHISFMIFLGYLIYIRTDEIIPSLFIYLLGIYVISYGLIIFLFGPRIINKIKIY